MKNYSFVVHDREGDDPYRRAELVGCLDSHTVIGFEKSIDGLLEQGVDNMLLSLENLTYISSAGISALMSLTHRLRQRGGELALYRPTDKVLRVLRTLGFTSIFRIITTEEEVATSFGH